MTEWVRVFFMKEIMQIIVPLLLIENVFQLTAVCRAMRFKWCAERGVDPDWAKLLNMRQRIHGRFGIDFKDTRTNPFYYLLRAAVKARIIPKVGSKTRCFGGCNAPLDRYQLVSRRWCCYNCCEQCIQRKKLNKIRYIELSFNTLNNMNVEVINNWNSSMLLIDVHNLRMTPPRSDIAVRCVLCVFFKKFKSHLKQKSHSLYQCKLKPEDCIFADNVMPHDVFVWNVNDVHKILLFFIGKLNEIDFSMIDFYSPSYPQRIESLFDEHMKSSPDGEPQLKKLRQ